MNLFDFLVLCYKAFGRFFRKIGVWLLQMVRLGLQYLWIVLPCAVLGVLGGWMWTKVEFTEYKGYATVFFADGMRSVVEDGLIEFMTLPKDVKMEKYGLTEKLLNKVGRLSFYNIIDCNADSVPDFIDEDRDIAYGDTLNVIMTDRVRVELEMKGSYDFGPFQRAFVQYFKDQNYLVTADKYYKQIQQERLEYFTKEVARLDSFSTYDYFLRPRYLGAEWGNHIISERDQELYYQDLMVVLKNKNYIEAQVLRTPDILNFQTPFVPRSLPLMIKYFIGLVLGGVFGLLIALLVKYRAVVFAYLKEK